MKTIIDLLENHLSEPSSAPESLDALGAQDSSQMWKMLAKKNSECGSELKNKETKSYKSLKKKNLNKLI